MDTALSLAELTLAHFTPTVNTTFDVPWNDQVVKLTLVLAAALPFRGGPPSAKMRTEPFQLQFLESQWSLPQHTHQLSHPVLGTLPIFLVPIGPSKDRAGFLYQAAFT